MTNLDLVQGLRELANFYEDNPAFPTPYTKSMKIFIPVFNKEQLSSLTKAFGTCRKEITDVFYTVIKDFGSGTVQIETYLPKAEVCRKKVLGVRLVPRQTIEVAEHEEEIVEWECHESLLETR